MLNKSSQLQDAIEFYVKTNGFEVLSMEFRINHPETPNFIILIHTDHLTQEGKRLFQATAYERMLANPSSFLAPKWTTNRLPRDAFDDTCHFVSEKRIQELLNKRTNLAVSYETDRCVYTILWTDIEEILRKRINVLLDTNIKIRRRKAYNWLEVTVTKNKSNETQKPISVFENDCNAFVPVTMYKCKFCGSVFATARRHRCRFQPANKSCLSCRCFAGISIRDDHPVEEGRKHIICNRPDVPDVSIKALAKNHWFLGCKFHSLMENYKGKETYYNRCIEIRAASARTEPSKNNDGYTEIDDDFFPFA